MSSDPGTMDISRVLFTDMENLDKINLNGMVSCQTQRAFFPNGLAMNGMAEALWNKKTDFAEYSLKYFIQVYGENGSLALPYLKELSRLLNFSFLRGEKKLSNDELLARYAEAKNVINEFAPVIEKNICCEQNPDKGVRRSWEFLEIHKTICLFIIKTMIAKAQGRQAAAEGILNDAIGYVRTHEDKVQDVYDISFFVRMSPMLIKQEKSNE
jgi:hypothetical protein